MVDHRCDFYTETRQPVLQLQQRVLVLHVEGHVVELEPAPGGLPRRLVELLHHAGPLEKSNRVVGPNLEEVVAVRVTARSVAGGRNQGHAQDVPVKPDGLFHVVGYHGQMIDATEFHAFSFSPMSLVSSISFQDKASWYHV